jgi:hypothetical protein
MAYDTAALIKDKPVHQFCVINHPTLLFHHVYVPQVDICGAAGIRAQYPQHQINCKGHKEVAVLTHNLGAQAGPDGIYQ